MQVEHKTEKGMVLFVLQPEEASDLTYPNVGMIDLYFQTKLQSKHEEDNYISIGLPDIGFELIGLTSDITEEQAKMMVLGRIDQTSFPTSMEYYNYCSEKIGHLSFDFEYALESFKSLMQFKKVYEVNPYLLISQFYQWYEAQSRTGKWIVLFKPND